MKKMPMRTIIFILSFLFLILPMRTLVASTVEWNHLQLSGGSAFDQGGETWRSYSWTEPYFSFCTHLEGDTLILRPNEGAFMEYLYGITLAEAGTVINPNSDVLPGSSFYFGFPDGSSDNFSAEILLGETAYFAYSVAYGNLMTGEPPDPSSPSRWGWLELQVTQDGDVVLRRDAFSWDRDPFVVGVSPEPASGLLLLVGGALLALRRQKCYNGRRANVSMEIYRPS